jgi:hypothetical protein
MRKRPGSVCDKWNISVVMCDTDILVAKSFYDPSTIFIFGNQGNYLSKKEITKFDFSSK